MILDWAGAKRSAPMSSSEIFPSTRTDAMGIVSLTRLVDTVRQVRRRGKALEKKTITIEEKPANLSKVAKLWSGLLDEVGDRKKGKAARSQLTEWVREQIHED